MESGANEKMWEKATYEGRGFVPPFLPCVQSLGCLMLGKVDLGRVPAAAILSTCLSRLRALDISALEEGLSLKFPFWYSLGGPFFWNHDHTLKWLKLLCLGLQTLHPQKEHSPW